MVSGVIDYSLPSSASLNRADCCRIVTLWFLSFTGSFHCVDCRFMCWDLFNYIRKVVVKTKCGRWKLLTVAAIFEWNGVKMIFLLIQEKLTPRWFTSKHLHENEDAPNDMQVIYI